MSQAVTTRSTTIACIWIDKVGKKRIEYIDALRGFTMILVVYAHIYACGLHSNSIYNELIVKFRMPLFFFISGWVLFKNERVWDFNQIKSFLSKKFLIQIIPTSIFFLLFVYLFKKLSWASFDNWKEGYWFTITLFEYFTIYSITQYFIYKLKLSSKNEDLVTIIVALIVYAISLMNFKLQENTLPRLICEIIGVYQLRFFVFFTLGTIIKKKFNSFIKFTDNPYYLAIIIIAFFSLHIFNDKIHIPLKQTLDFIIMGTFGIVITFTFFRKHQDLFSSNTKTGKILQFIGRRTLDVYLLHYFFIPNKLNNLSLLFEDSSNSTIELFITMILSLMVLIMSLLASSVLRLSPFLGKFLFGVKP